MGIHQQQVRSCDSSSSNTLCVDKVTWLVALKAETTRSVSKAAWLAAFKARIRSWMRGFVAYPTRLPTTAHLSHDCLGGVPVRHQGEQLPQCQQELQGTAGKPRVLVPDGRRVMDAG